MNITRKAAALLTVAMTVGVCAVVAGTASADGCRVAQRRPLDDEFKAIRLVECPSPRSSAERIAYGELIAGKDGEEVELYYYHWQVGGPVPGSKTRSNGSHTTRTPEYYSRPNELQVCSEGKCTWPE